MLQTKTSHQMEREKEAQQEDKEPKKNEASSIVLCLNAPLYLSLQTSYR